MARKSLSFEIVLFDKNANEMSREVRSCSGPTAARGIAGRLAKRHGGPVDLAYAGQSKWVERYITTALPSQYHKAGFQFERI